ncbi:hypothetical protein SERLA73DRAFT_190956 [Serpula lacrymans var. lacrymans S7.3]|uniref:Uncharacterized protein n=1 Tax=Serpula lacrymans var. lacrymans (strain S7.3) TaxID=936435 RepID=F8QGQ0_SERL3|nr:hypothetical protein SERLA73DRAFT_190956 [Serpula lacrymans var. lacrymans S7.3]
MNGMMLHDGVLGLGREVVGMVEGFGDMEGVGVGQMPYFSHHRFELESMPEDMEVEDEDEDGRFGVDKGFGLGAESEVSTQGEDDGEENSGGLVRGRKRDRERERSRAGVVKEGEAEDMDV